MQKIITERPNLFEPDDYITFYMELSGKVRAKDLADAVKAAYRANESTMSAIGKQLLPVYNAVGFRKKNKRNFLTEASKI